MRELEDAGERQRHESVCPKADDGSSACSRLYSRNQTTRAPAVGEPDRYPERVAPLARKPEDDLESESRQNMLQSARN
jgi:hypothetical protein